MRQRKFEAKQKKDAQPSADSDIEAKKQEYIKSEARRERVMKGLVIGAICFLLLNALLKRSLWNKFGYFLKECEGEMCTLEGVEVDRECGPWDADKLVYVRIPKTGSTSIKNALIDALKIKPIPVANLGEWFDAVPNVLVKYVPPMSKMEGYIDDPNLGLRKPVRFKFYSPIAQKVAKPAHVYNRSFFEGHVFHLEWEEAAGVFPYPKILDHVPQIRDYLFPVPTKEELQRIEEISFLRKPAKRLASMYNYDRTMARNKMWRDKFIQERGEKSFEDCLLDAKCVEVNELERWCSLQTEFLCGLHADCVRPLTQKALDRAKANVDSKLVFVGLLERLDESMKILEQLFPVYFEGLSKIEINHNMRTPEYDPVANAKAMAVLNQICRLDNELYEYVETAMRKRQTKCGFKMEFL